jgi:hypothetical protein
MVSVRLAPESPLFRCVSRAVGGYLQGVFEGLNADTSRRDKDMAPKIGLDHTLRGKTRKEAARMFFETLVWTF